MTPTFDMLSSYLIKYSHSKKDVATNWSLYPNVAENHLKAFLLYKMKIMITNTK